MGGELQRLMQVNETIYKDRDKLREENRKLKDEVKILKERNLELEGLLRKRLGGI